MTDQIWFIRLYSLFFRVVRPFWDSFRKNVQEIRVCPSFLKKNRKDVQIRQDGQYHIRINPYKVSKGLKEVDLGMTIRKGNAL